MKLSSVGSLVAVVATLHSAFNVRRLRRPSTTPGRLALDVSILIPARDEEANLEACLASVCAQSNADRIEVIVLDDGSTDRTAEIASRFPAVRLVTGTPPGPGQLGKSNACRQLAALANGELLVFVDADVRLVPHAVAAAAELMIDADLDVISPYPREIAESVGERLLQPLLQWSWLTFLPLGLAERSPRTSLAAANGQFLLIRRDTYLAAGHPDSVLDDIALARAVRRAGGRGGFVDGSRLAHCRMYDGWHQIRDGYGKSLPSAFGSTAATAALGAALGIAYVLPPIAAVRGSRIGLLGYLAALVGRVITARTCGARIWPDCAAHPASVGALLFLVVDSGIRSRRGTLTWRGRPVRP
jgi:glycosyltransferase involved in cell wall biosynthesis